MPVSRPIRTVGIISAVGDTLMLEHVTKAPFEWIGPPDDRFIEISDWGLDDLVTKTATDALSPRYAVKPVTFAEADFDTWTWSSLVRALKEMPLPVDDIDAYVVILRDWRGDAIGDSVHDVGGLGVYRRDRPAKTQFALFASYRIAIVDARTFDVLAERRATVEQGHLPWITIAPSAWPTNRNDPTDAQRARLRSGLASLIDATLAPTLRTLMPPAQTPAHAKGKSE